MLGIATPENVSSSNEQQSLHLCERIISKGLVTFRDVGNALLRHVFGMFGCVAVSENLAAKLEGVRRAMLDTFGRWNGVETGE
jgi:hypothetical protein